MPNQNQVMELDIKLEHEQRLIKRINFKISRPSRVVVLNVGPQLREIVAAQEAVEHTASIQSTPTKRSRRAKKDSLTKETSTSASASTSTRTTRASTRAATAATIGSNILSEEQGTPIISNFQKRRKPKTATHNAREDSGSDTTFTTPKRRQRRAKVIQPIEQGKGKEKTPHGDDGTDVFTDDPTTATYGTMVEPYFRRGMSAVNSSYYGFNDALVGPTAGNSVNMSSNHGQSATFNSTFGAFDNPFDLTDDPQPNINIGRTTHGSNPSTVRPTQARAAESGFDLDFDTNTGRITHRPSPNLVRTSHIGPNRSAPGQAQAGPAGPGYDLEFNTNTGRTPRGPNQVPTRASPSLPAPVPAQAGPAKSFYDTLVPRNILNRPPSYNRNPAPAHRTVSQAPAQAGPAKSFYDTLVPGNVLNRPTGSSSRNCTPTPSRPPIISSHVDSTLPVPNPAQAQAGPARSFHDTPVPGNVLNRPSGSTPRAPNPALNPSELSLIDPALLEQDFRAIPAPNSIYDTPEKIKSWYTFGTNDVQTTEKPPMFNNFDLGIDFDAPFLG